MAQTPEGKVKDRVKKILKERGVFFFMPAANGYGSTGILDFIGLYKGRFFAIEAKAGDNKPTALQYRFLDNVNNAGGMGIWVNEHTAEIEINLMLDAIELQTEG